MSVRTADPRYTFQLPSLSYIDAKWEEPNLRAAAQPVRDAGVAAWLSRRVRAFVSWRRDSQAADELTAMSDHQLKDIGLARSDLNRVFDTAFNEDLRRRGTYA